MRNYDSRRTIVTSIITSLLSFVILVIFTLGYVGNKVGDRPQNNYFGSQVAKQPTVPDPVPKAETAAAEIPKVAAVSASNVASSSVQSVVGIAVLKPDSKTLFDLKGNKKYGIGSGIIVSSNGYILTNQHVAGDKNNKEVVTFSSGKVLDGVTLWSDPVIDLAIVKVDASGLTAARLGDSKALKIGEQAVAIGNPLGLQFQRTVTSGIISALNRTIRIDTERGPNYMEDLIQTDASINPGNSGGPLMNAAGEVIGINTIKVASAEGLGFAIPINMAKPVVNSFVSKGRFDEAYLGFFAYDKETLPYVNTNIGTLDSGVYVVTVDPKGPAASKGIKYGDVVTKVDGTDIHTMADLRTIIYSKNPNDTANLSVVTGGASKQVVVRLGRKITNGLISR